MPTLHQKRRLKAGMEFQRRLNHWCCDQRLRESRFQSLFLVNRVFRLGRFINKSHLTYQILLVLQPRLVVDLGILDPRAAAAAVAAAAADAVLPAAVGPVARRGPVGAAAAAAVLLHGGFLLLLPEGHPADRQVPSKSMF